MTDKAEQVGADLGAINTAIKAPFGAVAGEFAGVGGGQLTVNHDTVLQAGKIIQDQVDQLSSITVQKLRDLRPGNIGDDVVSAEATKQWTEVLVTNPDSYDKRIRQYIDGLQKLADQLKTAAQQYGYTEDQIAQAFGAQQ
jgi:hypothetical protein